MAQVTELKRQSAAERQARIELAVFYRLVEYLGWGEGIYNHISLRLPEEPNMFLIKAHALTYDEVTASNLVKVDCREDLDERAGVNKVGFTTHAPIIRARQDVNCAVHIHTVPIMAMCAHPQGLRMLGVHSATFYQDIAYQEYRGVFENVDEQQRIIDDLGDKRVLLMRNHGAVITGSSVEDTFTALYSFAMACEVQLRIEASGHEPVEIDPKICAETVLQMKSHAKGRGGANWPAWIRRMDRLDPGYKD
jgi:ribulose-5-phosphate 4-epimerase/fuculose-1-phosphate aldolase